MAIPMKRLAFAFAAALVSLAAGPARAQKFLPDDPVLKDRDDLPIDLPAEIELATSYDVLENSWHHRPDKTSIPAAQNANTLGEVPDSSWFTNRIGVKTMSIEELVRGPNRGDGPATEQAWTVIGGKSGGITPGFTMRDGRGDIYFVKFDPPQYFGLSTGADVIGSKFFHSFGYYVPENWVVYVEQARLRVGEGAQVRVRSGKPRPMTQADLDAMMTNVARLPDGRIRCVASRAVPGKVVGPHKYYGTRPDDPNDVIPHEHRRELRGYRVFSTWLNHDDSRSVNSINSYVKAGERGYLVHYLQDFSSMLGSGSDWQHRIAPQNPRAGNEYILEVGPILKTALSLGLWERPWRGVKYRVYPQVGGIEAEFFDPDQWKPEYPNPAFERMLPEDAFWAARIVSKFSDAAIQAIVKEGDFRASEAEAHLASMIEKRRDKIVARYFGSLNPLADFTVTSDAVRFANYGEDAGLARVEAYEHEWFAFNNQTSGTESLGVAVRATGRSLPLPAARPEYLMLRIRTHAPGFPAWGKRVDVYLRSGASLAIVGVDRES
jgi:hypothetical protein